MTAGGGLPLPEWDASPPLKSWVWGSGGCHCDAPSPPWPSLENWLWVEYWQACGSLLLFLFFSSSLPASLSLHSPMSFLSRKLEEIGQPATSSTTVEKLCSKRENVKSQWHQSRSLLWQLMQSTLYLAVLFWSCVLIFFLEVKLKAEDINNSCKIHEQKKKKIAKKIAHQSLCVDLVSLIFTTKDGCWC